MTGVLNPIEPVIESAGESLGALSLTLNDPASSPELLSVLDGAANFNVVFDHDFDFRGIRE
jgi:hypothetical protein